MIQFSVELTNPLTESLSFDYIVGEGTATPSVDFTPMSGHLTIPAGQTSVLISIPTLNRSGYQGNRSLTLRIENIVSTTMNLAPIQATGVIEEISLTPGMIKNLNRNSKVLTKLKVGNKLFFTGFTDDTGEELWVTDATVTGTRLVKDIKPGPAGSLIGNFFAFNGVLYFEADDGVHGSELWRSDGTPAGTYLVSDSLPDGKNGYFYPHLIFNNALFFSVSTSESTSDPRLQIWKMTADEQVSPFFTPNSDPSATGSAQKKTGTMLALNGSLYFEGRLTTCGGLCPTYGLYKSDGTVVGTQLLKDSSGGSAIHNIEWMDACGGKIYFGTYTSAANSNDQLWMSDGTAAGTGILKNIGGANSADVGPLGCINGRLIFEAVSPGIGYEPWVSDGTAAGTNLLKDIEPGAGSFKSLLALNSSLIRVNMPGGVLFSAYESTHGQELWFTDGTPAGTILLKDIVPGLNSTLWDARPGQTLKPNSWTLFNNEVYFYAEADGVGFELWKTNGTPTGTVRVKDIYPGGASSYPHGFIEFNGRLVFAGRDDIHGQELWSTDGTESGTNVFLELNSGAENSAFENLMVFDSDTLIYTAYDSTLDSAQLGYYKASTQNTEFLRGPWIADEDMGYNFLFRIGQKIFFAGDDGSWGTKIYKTDLTNQGTGLFYELAPNGGCNSFSAVGEYASDFYFVATTPEVGKEIWKTDGTVLGTMLLKDIVPGPAGISYVGSAAVINNKLLFTATESTNGREFWVTDGTATGTSIVKDIATGVVNGVVDIIGIDTGAMPQILYFVGFTSSGGEEIYKTDGTTLGTSQVSEVTAGSTDPQFSSFNAVNDGFVFSARGTNGTELYLLKGGALTFKDICAGACDSLPRNFAEMGGHLYFSALTIATGRELWRTDGTSAGTTLIKDINPGGGGSDPFQFKSVGAKMFFQGYTGATGIEPYVTDGTAANTVLLRDFNLGLGDATSWGNTPISFNDQLYFEMVSTTDGVGNELYVSDGTPAGTKVFKDFEPGGGSSDIYKMFVFKNELYIFVNAPSTTSGVMLWKTDGTEIGTVLVKDFADADPGSYGINLSLMANGSTRFYFYIKTAAAGLEVWKSDGTNSGTVMTQNNVPGIDGLNSIGNTYLFENDTLIYTATSEKNGRELYIAYP
jgi:ELWxxDGT repeat protein